jgi:acetyltransferase-like isoleucine patch superfamily enzyme
MIAIILNTLKTFRILLLVHIKWRNYVIGKNPFIGRHVHIWAKNSIIIGKNFYIGKFSQIECDVEIGDNVILASHVALIGRYDHHYQQIGVPIRLASQIRDKHYTWKGLSQKIIVEDDVWIGHGSLVLSGIKIARGSIIAAGSIVTKDVQPFSIYAGAPAKKIGDRFENSSDLNEHMRLYNLNYK